MAQYTPEFLAVLRHRYEQTHQSERSIAYDFGVAASTVRAIARKHGWSRLPEPMRDLEPAMRLLEEATALEREVNRQRGLPDLDFEETPARIPVARYTPRLLAVLRRRYEHTRQSARSIAFDFDISERTLRRIASTRGSRRPDPAWHDLEPAARLLEEATALEQLYFGGAGKKST